jgi:hypothetical protein
MCSTSSRSTSCSLRRSAKRIATPSEGPTSEEIAAWRIRAGVASTRSLVGCGSEPAHRDRLPIKTNGAHVVGADDLLIGDSVALEVSAGRVAPNHLGPARVDGFERQGSPIAPSWVGGLSALLSTIGVYARVPLPSSIVNIAARALVLRYDVALTAT